MLVLAIVGCGKSQNDTKALSENLFASKPSNFQLHLTDAPHQTLKSVFVNVKHIELWLEKNTIHKRLILAPGLGKVDLLKLQSGVMMSLAQVSMPPGVKVTKIRLILEDSGHYSIKSDDSICEMKTPSAQKTGIKILLPESILFEDGYSYSMVVDFDAAKSVVVQGNGNCLLKPVLKLKSANRIDWDHLNSDGTANGGGDDLVDESDDVGNDDSGDGFDDDVIDDGAGGEVIFADDLYFQLR